MSGPRKPEEFKGLKKSEKKNDLNTLWKNMQSTSALQSSSSSSPTTQATPQSQAAVSEEPIFYFTIAQLKNLVDPEKKFPALTGGQAAEMFLRSQGATTQDPGKVWLLRESSSQQDTLVVSFYNKKATLTSGELKPTKEGTYNHYLLKLESTQGTDEKWFIGGLHGKNPTAIIPNTPKTVGKESGLQQILNIIAEDATNINAGGTVRLNFSDMLKSKKDVNNTKSDYMTLASALSAALPKPSATQAQRETTYSSNILGPTRPETDYSSSDVLGSTARSTKSTPTSTSSTTSSPGRREEHVNQDEHYQSPRRGGKS